MRILRPASRKATDARSRHRRSRAGAAALAGLAASWPAGAAACAVAPLVSPAPGAALADPRPLLRWRPAAGVDRYRVQVLARLAEGAVVERVDTIVAGTAFEPPRALSDRHATVQVLVTDAACGEADVGATPAAFFIDPALACPAPASLAVSRAGDAAKALWASVERALEYELRVFHADGKPVARLRTKATAATVAAPAGAVFGVRALCAAGPGRDVWSVP